MGIYENFDEQKQFACRVIADHARATAFAIADGILPGNEGRNYVLRKIMRRAIYHGREHLGFDEPFFYKVCDFVVGEMKDAYPELETQREFIGKMVRLEEERFGNTLTVGLSKLNETLSKTKHVVFSELAKLYDTFGTPKDLIFVTLLERGLINNEEEFEEIFNIALRNLQQSSEIGKTKQSEKINPIYKSLEEALVRSNFHGYDATRVEDAKVLAIVKDDEKVDELASGEEGSIILDETPFYAESGGQVGDRGILFNNKGAQISVQDTFAPIPGIVLHKSTVRGGSIKVGDSVTASVDEEQRDATRRNHTATHLVHAALKEVLGTHVKQAGSVVAPQFLRFDFTHYQPLSAEEVEEVENLVNHYILQNEPVTTNVMAIEEAMRSGAVALFGEKYGADVRVLSVGEGVFSKELCGGTHVRATGDIGSFKITADESVASGVRRIRAITGFDAFRRFRDDEKLIENSLKFLKTQRDQLPSAIEKMQEELKRYRKEVEDLRVKIATGAINSDSANGDESREISGVKVLAKQVEDLDANAVRQLSDNLLNRLKSGVVVIGRKADGKVSLIVRVSDDLTDKIRAGNIIREIAPIIGGRGGGKADMAEGGGADADKLGEALTESYKVIEKMLG